MRREMISLNTGWHYYPGDDLPEVQLNFTGLEGTEVDLPHCWNGETAVDPDQDGYGQSIGWYQKQFLLPEALVGQRLFLDLEGVSGIGTVFVNDQLAGRHLGGYTGFTLEVTQWLRAGENLLTIKADNRDHRDLIPSRISDFYVYGGISRNVWLYGTGQVNFAEVKVRGEEVSAESAQLRVEFALDGVGEDQLEGLELLSEISGQDSRVGSDGRLGLDVILHVSDPQGEVVESRQLTLAEIKSGRCTVQVAVPKLWSPEVPNLYQVELALSQNGQVQDQWQVETGLRWFEFKRQEAFYLNGERVLLRGTHIHEDAPLVGNALTDEEHVAELELVKSAGFNFVRLGHYPQSPAVMQVCDRLGLLVWCELPWCRGGVGGAEFRLNTKETFREMVAQNYNHPSIIIWGLGNEFVEDIANPDHILDNLVDEDVISLVQELHDLAYQLDGSRVTAIRKYEPAAGIVDVYSPTIWAGWYRFEPFTEYGALIEGYREKYKSFFHMEYGGGGLRGRYNENWQEQIPERGVEGDFNMNYANELFEWHIITLQTSPWITGAAQWAFKDFATPLRPENDIPYVNMKGLVDRAGQPKDPYYIYKSYWGTEPVLFIESHDWTHRWGEPGEGKLVKVYSNCDQVELFVNGLSQGMRSREVGKFPAAGLTWEVQFVEGENQIQAVGIFAGQDEHQSERIVDSHTLQYVTHKWGEPVAVELETARVEFPESGIGYEVRATLVDAEGQRCLDADQRIRFSHQGVGELLVNLGTAEGSKLVGLACGQGCIRLLPNGESGSTKISVQVEGLEIEESLEFQIG